MNSCFNKRNNYWEGWITQRVKLFLKIAADVFSYCKTMQRFYGTGHICYGLMTGLNQMEHEVCVCVWVWVRPHSFLFMCLGGETNESAMSYYLYHSSTRCNNKSQHCRAPAGRCNTIDSPLMTQILIICNSSFRPCPQHSGYFHEEKSASMQTAILDIKNIFLKRFSKVEIKKLFLVDLHGTSLYSYMYQETKIKTEMFIFIIFLR